MQREATNRLRFVLEDLLPPAVRDSGLMRGLFRLYWGKLVDELESFRQRIPFVTEEEYADLYRRLPRIQSETDNSAKCIKKIVAQVLSGSVCDIGCGTGYLLDRLHETGRFPQGTLTGVDIVVPEEVRSRYPWATFHEAKIEALPFPDRYFDTVICTHVLEHVLDIRAAIRELRRVCRRQLIIVVPQEREHSFTFNPHIHFFPYPHSFLRHIIPIPETYSCERIGRDLFYMESTSN